MEEHDNYARYAVKSDDMRAIKEKLERLLGIEMQEIGSGAWGNYFIHPLGNQPDQISVFSNQREEDDETVFNEEEYSDYPLIISIVDSPHQDKYQEILTGSEVGAVLVRRRDIPYPDPEPFVFDEDSTD